MPALYSDSQVKVTDRDFEGAVGKDVKQFAYVPEL